MRPRALGTAEGITFFQKETGEDPNMDVARASASFRIFEVQMDEIPLAWR